MLNFWDFIKDNSYKSSALTLRTLVVRLMLHKKLNTHTCISSICIFDQLIPQPVIA